MRSLSRWLVFLLLAVAARGADGTLKDALRAQMLLGPTVWSRILRIENEARTGVYPRTLHALVFEFAGILWFYTGVDGTQSLSLHQGRLAEEKADLAPLLREIDAGFHRWQEVAAELPLGEAGMGSLRNGCVIQSIVALRTRVALGLETLRPTLLAYYAESPTGVKGHTVLAFESGGRVGIVDSDRAAEVRWFPLRQMREPLALAREVGGPRISRAKFFPLSVPPDWMQAVAAGESPERSISSGRIVTVR